MTDGFFHRFHFSMCTQLRFQLFFSRGWGSFRVNDDDYRVFAIISCCVRWLTIIAGDFSGAWFLHRIRLRNQNADHAAEHFTKLKVYARWVERRIGIYTQKLQCVNGAATWLRNCIQNAHTTRWRNHNLKSHDGAKYRCHCFSVRIFLSRKMHFDASEREFLANYTLTNGNDSRFLRNINFAKCSSASQPSSNFASIFPATAMNSLCRTFFS